MSIFRDFTDYHHLIYWFEQQALATLMEYLAFSYVKGFYMNLGRLLSVFPKKTVPKAVFHGYGKGHFCIKKVLQKQLHLS